jgi:hypothetical protein
VEFYERPTRKQGKQTMPMITILAHFDGKQICLDESNDEREAWLNLPVQSLEDGYGEDEPEYSTDLIKKVNPHYAGR